MNDAADIAQAFDALRFAAAKLEISPQGFYEAVRRARPNSAAQRAADDELERLDLLADRERAG